MKKFGLTKIRALAWVPLLAATAVLCGCATVYENTHAYLGSPQFGPTTPEHVQIYSTEPKMAKVALGEIILSIDGNPPRDKVEQKLKMAAAKLGADGVFIASDKTHIYPVVYWDYWGPTSAEDWHRMVVGVAFRNGESKP
jgi:hypothetical protein